MIDKGKNHSRIDKAFEWAKKEGVIWATNKSNKERNADSSYKTYANIMKSYESYLQEKCGLKDITRAKPKHAVEFMQYQINAYKNEEKGSAYTMRQFPHALHALQMSARESGAYRGLKLGSKSDLLQLLNNNKIYRKSDASKALKANASDYQKVHAEILNSKSPQSKTIADIHQTQRYIGCRIHEAVKMKKQDVQFHKDGTATIYIKGKGGHDRWVSVKHKETITLLKENTCNKKDGAFIFQVKNRRGNDKDKASAQKNCQDVIRAAAERAAVDRNGKKYVTHSGRKVFAQERMNSYARQSYKQLEKELQQRIKKYPLDKNNRNKLEKKVRDELNEFRKKIDPKGKLYSKEHRDRKRAERKFTHKELCQFLVSVDTGHFRCNIMRFYCDYPNPSKDKST
ncbi:tyrosine-type recombinase/integrase [Priestia megaterium]|nr:tyrosine-type recombinase/integrase [Priestia megaterium]